MIFPVYKPKGVSSFDVIRKLRKEYPKGTKIGHGGTLDPLAEGVLVIGIGKESTKKLSEILKDSTKEYIAEFELGKTSETDDAEGPVESTGNSEKPSEKEVQNILEGFLGTTEQVPPKYSAVKVNGQPAYKRARRGEEFTLEPKEVTVHAIELLSYEYPIIKVRVETGSGVYIRALARDVGKKLGTGAYMKSLIRTRVGEYATI